MINSRNKGAGAERELSKLLYDELGVKLLRNLEQSRDGGHDLLAEHGSLLDGYAIEVKRYANVSMAMLKGFWQQAIGQAANGNKIPVLMYRQDRQDWLAVIPLHVINGNLSESNHFDSVAILNLSAFCAVVRERG
ncbi:MAG: hypothetical protein ABL903_02000 [Methylococcales bacterium]